jgi:RNA polymerase sigma-70 factor (ECF subfamily)
MTIGVVLLHSQRQGDRRWDERRKVPSAKVPSAKVRCQVPRCRERFRHIRFQELRLRRPGNFFAKGRQYSRRVDDARLLQRACKGDETAFCALFARYQRRIFQYASRMCGPGAGDDVVQETFLAVLKGTKFDPSRGTVEAYLLGIARHHIVRRLAPKDADALNEPTELLNVNRASLVDTPLETLARGEIVETVRAAVDSLPPMSREVVVLCDLQEIDYATVAELIQRPLGTVRSRLHRARTLLVQMLTTEVSQRGVRQKHG